MTKRELIDIVERFVPVLQHLKIKDLYNYKYFSEKKNKHYSFEISLNDKEGLIYAFAYLRIMICKYKNEHIMIWFDVMDYEENIDVFISKKYFTVHLNSFNEVVYSTDNEKYLKLKF